MKRLVYIIFLSIVAIAAIVAQNSGGIVAPGIFSDTVAADLSLAEFNDSMAPDSVLHPDSVQLPDSSGQSQSAVGRSQRKRYVSPVNNAATRTQYHNDAEGDTARMLERRRQRSTHYHDENGNMIMVDTVTGEEWMDSTLLPTPPKMKQPLLFRVEVGVNIWDPVMRIFGQKYGGLDFSAALNLHNRYIPTIEAGFGMAHKTPATMNYTYTSPLSPYFKIGADYNFVYNSNPDYRFVAGVRYGFSSFKYGLENVTFDDNYWGETGAIDFPTQKVTAGWFELVLGLRVKIAGPISAGWMFRYHSLLHQTKPSTGSAWYIPGYGTSGSSITGSFSFVYNFSIGSGKHASNDTGIH